MAPTSEFHNMVKRIIECETKSLRERVDSLEKTIKIITDSAVKKSTPVQEYKNNFGGKNVHTEHCCIEHGCKYGENSYCPVVNGFQKQSYPCEQCYGVIPEVELVNNIYKIKNESYGINTLVISAIKDWSDSDFIEVSQSNGLADFIINRIIKEYVIIKK